MANSSKVRRAGKQRGGGESAGKSRKTAAVAGRKGRPGGKRTRETAPAATIEQSSSEGELSEEDMAYFNEGELEQYGFLSKMDAASLAKQTKGKRKKQDMSEEAARRQQKDSDDEDANGSSSDDALAAYEEAPRQGEWNKRERDEGRLGLPIKLPDGRVQRGARLEAKSESSDDEEEKEEEEEKKAKAQKKKRAAAKEEGEGGSMQASLRSKKERLATIAQAILADPEGQASCMHCYYRIRELTEHERSVKVSAELRKLRNYEETLVFYYRAYIDTLLQEGKGGGDADTAPGSMSFIVTKCICTLLTYLSHFNFRSELIKALVQRLGARRWSELSMMARETVITLFKEDASGEISLEIVKQITQMVKKRDYNVHPQVLATFFHLRLRDELNKPKDDDAAANGKDGKKRKQEKVHLTKRERKRRRVQKEVESEMREAEAEYSREERERMYNETLKMVFITYFRVLKQGDTSPLLPAVLEGLAKFAHLISVDYFEDLLALLKKLMLRYHPDYEPEQPTIGDKKAKRRHAKLIGGDQETGTAATGEAEEQYAVKGQDGDAVRMPLLCLITIAQVLSGHGEALNYDLKEFYALLYTLLFPVAMKAGASETIDDEGRQTPLKQTDKATRAATDTELVMRGLDALLLQRKHVPMERVAAFLKRMAIASLHMSPVMTTNALDRIRTVMTRKHQLDALLSDEEGRMGNGVYRATLDDPDLCNPMATNLWELALLKDHYDPQVRQKTDALLQLSSSSSATRARTAAQRHR
ncbi:CBF/Mak21 family-domain-containing protein [Syncephalis pseudoplumigaleata]|uniref:Nucleolar complex-associated protein 3 n=1 Tax=Syncephalis pseudoplumigaleata TaxID=1712513 RepID=A0A4P9Z1X8_9FUNG|nr:CBF/Mak21 family-domain-containing protein [Syncephalis pseudoplumigaleata]|eukprot:RKP25972.1 CBF/Mak21 family-domain-containing protein [Syncephalis pseudoplumigaleata]